MGRDAHKTQRSRILGLLIDAHGRWVSLSAILDLGIAQYNARIFELRKLGFCIENRTERGSDGKRRSYFRLVAPTQRVAPCLPARAETSGLPPAESIATDPPAQSLYVLPEFCGPLEASTKQLATGLPAREDTSKPSPAEAGSAPTLFADLTPPPRYPD